MSQDYNGTPLPENQIPGSGKDDQNDNIPDWMKDAGWETSSGAFDESKPVFDDLDDDEDEIVPADIPAWLEEAAPEGFSSDPNATPAFEGLDVDEPFITTGDLVPPADMQPLPEEPEPDQPPSPEKPAEQEIFDIPTWLENLELDEDSQETAVAWLENMPESLRATEEELEAAKEFPTEEKDVIEEPVDELAWVDEIAFEEEPSISIDEDQAALSEDLVASELIPEAGDLEHIFEDEEIESMESELPSWLNELGDDQPVDPVIEETQPTPPLEEIEAPPEMKEDALPDWLRTIEEADVTEPAPAPSPEPSIPSDVASDIPDWLSDFEESAPDSAPVEDSLEWLDSLGPEEAPPAPTPQASAEEIIETVMEDKTGFPDPEPEETLQIEPAAPVDDFVSPEDVSPDDETLNTQIPDWLSKIDDKGEIEEQEPLSLETTQFADDGGFPLPEDDFESSDSWLDQIDETPSDGLQEEVVSQESAAAGWLDDLEGVQEESSADEITAVQDTFAEDTSEEFPAAELETAKYLEHEPTEEEDLSDDLPDWLSELREDEDKQGLSLEEAIRRADHDLNEEEVDFLNRIDERQEDEVDWLSKLDQDDIHPDLAPPGPTVDLDPMDVEGPIEDHLDDPIVSGGMLERLKYADEEDSEEDVPQWLTDLKKEEDPQETAVLWLQQFVNQGGDVDINDEIKRYTDELDPGDAIPKWMEDLKNEEDPQTTAMLWLERLSGGKKPQAPPASPATEDEETGWLADLEREASETAQEESKEAVKEFDSTDDGWLADLEIDEKLKPADEDRPDWAKSEDEITEDAPPWMRATSPLEGDFFTDELKGEEEQEIEIPEWLAGYAEGEGPQDIPEQEAEDDEEYTWLSAKETPAAPRAPLDLNKAAISQLESILGISHQIAKGIVSYRESHGPYRDFSDLNNVPEITDEQTIDILKPEVFIGEVPAEEEPIVTPAPKIKPKPPKRKPPKTPATVENYEEMLVTARAKVNDRLIDEAIELYSALVKKKKFLDEAIEDLQKAALDHPLEIAIQKTLGEAFMKKDMLDEALEAYSKAEDLLS